MQPNKQILKKKKKDSERQREGGRLARDPKTDNGEFLGLLSASYISDLELNDITIWDFPGGPVGKTPHFHCRGTGSIPGQGTKISHVQHSLKIII